MSMSTTQDSSNQAQRSQRVRRDVTRPEHMSGSLAVQRGVRELSTLQL